MNFSRVIIVLSALLAVSFACDEGACTCCCYSDGHITVSLQSDIGGNDRDSTTSGPPVTLPQQRVGSGLSTTTTIASGVGNGLEDDVCILGSDFATFLTTPESVTVLTCCEVDVNTLTFGASGAGSLTINDEGVFKDSVLDLLEFLSIFSEDVVDIDVDDDDTVNIILQPYINSTEVRALQEILNSVANTGASVIISGNGVSITPGVAIIQDAAPGGGRGEGKLPSNLVFCTGTGSGQVPGCIPRANGGNDDGYEDSYEGEENDSSKKGKKSDKSKKSKTKKSKKDKKGKKKGKKSLFLGLNKPAQGAVAAASVMFVVSGLITLFMFQQRRKNYAMIGAETEDQKHVTTEKAPLLE